MSFAQAYVCNQCGLAQRKYVPPLWTTPIAFHQCCPQCGAGIEDIRLAIGEWKQQRIVRGLWPFRFVEYVDSVFEEKPECRRTSATDVDITRHCPVCVVDDDSPTRLGGTMEPEHQFVTRDDFDQFRSWLSQQRTAEWTRLMEHSHGVNGEVIFPDMEE